MASVTHFGVFDFALLIAYTPPVAFSESTARDVAGRWGGLAAEASVNPFLLLAVVAQESRGNQFAARDEPSIGDQSRGLAQILTGTLAQMQAEGRVPRQWTSDDLWNPRINLETAEAVITRQIAWWSGDLPRAIASYNAGINLRQGDPLARAIPGYVDAVLAYYDWFQGSWAPPGPPEMPPGYPGPGEDQPPPGEGTGGIPTVATLGGAGVLVLGLLVAWAGSR